MCPYYFILEEKFTCCAGIQPAATSERLFESTANSDKPSSTGMDDNDNEYDFNGEVASEAEGNGAGSCVGLSTENHYDNSRHNSHTTNTEISPKNNH